MTNYKTTDLGLATYLYAISLELSGVEDGERQNQKVIVFDVPPTTNIDGVIEEYRRNKATINPKRYFAALREIKNEIHNF